MGNAWNIFYLANQCTKFYDAFLANIAMAFVTECGICFIKKCEDRASDIICTVSSDTQSLVLYQYSHLISLEKG